MGETEFAVPVAWVATMLGAVVAGYPVLWAFWSRIVNGLLERQNEVVDAWQQTAMAREDKHREELLSAIRELEDRREARVGSLQAEFKEDFQQIQQRLARLEETLQANHHE